MKPTVPVTGAVPLPREAPARKRARQRRLQAVLRKGLGLSSSELSDSLWPGYAENFRAGQPAAAN